MTCDASEQPAAGLPVMFFTVVVRSAAADARLPGRAETLARELSGQRTDGLVYWVLMSAGDALGLVDALKRRGLRFLVDGVAEDIAVIDMMRGCASPCPWLKVSGTPGELRLTLSA